MEKIKTKTISIPQIFETPPGELQKQKYRAHNNRKKDIIYWLQIINLKQKVEKNLKVYYN